MVGVVAESAPTEKDIDRPYASWQFVVPVLLFYASSALPVERLFNNLRITSDVAAFVAGAAAAAMAPRANNIFILFTVGFFQPFIVYAAFIYETPALLEDAFLYRIAAEVGAACLAGGLLASGALQTIRRDTFAVRPWWEFMTLLDDAQGRVSKTGKMVTGLLRLAPAWGAVIHWLLATK